MLLLFIGLAIFLLTHLLPTAPDLRNGLTERFGTKAYRILFSSFSLVGFILIVLGYHKIQIHTGKNVFLWESPEWLHIITWLLMWPAMIFLVAAYVPSRIRTTLKHPMLAAVKVWALSHLIVNGDVASLLLFGSFLGYAIYDRISIAHRETSKSKVAPSASPYGDILVLVVGSLAYFFMLFVGHAWFIGVPLLNT